MKTVALTEENIKDFTGYLGEDIAEKVGREFIKGFALIDVEDSIRAALLWGLKNSEDPKKDTVSEIMFLRFEDMEAGEELLERYRERAELDDVKTTQLELSVSDADAVRLMLAQGYDVTEAKSRYLNVRLSDFQELPLFQKLPADYVRPLIYVDIKTFRSAVEHSRSQGKRVASEDVDYLPMDWYEQDISCCAHIGGKIEGFLLIHKTPSGILVPEALFAKGDDARKIILNMLRCMVERALEIYPPHTMVRIHRPTDDIRSITNTLFEDFSGENVFFCRKMEQLI